MFYGSISRAYVPGGVNTFSAVAASLPEYTSTYGSEVVLDHELGVKYDFTLGGAPGRIDLDGYWDNFSNIIEPFTGVVGATSVVYNENIAGAKLHGVELQATLVPVQPLEITIGYNYNDAYYTSWIGQDPFNAATPGSAICLPWAAIEPAGQCFLEPWRTILSRTCLSSRGMSPCATSCRSTPRGEG